MVLNNNELMDINGGAMSKWGFVIFLGGMTSFLVGVLDGFLRPLTCNK